MDENNLSQAPDEKNKSSFWKELGRPILLSLLIVIPFRLYIAQPFIVDGASMDPTFKNGEYLIVDEISYNFKNPERGSVLVFKYPKDPQKYFIKRVIGLPGEEISIRNGEITIRNSENPNGFVLEEDYIEFEKYDNFSYKLESSEYFVMGDNRASSSDSRIWGPVPEDNIIGRPVIRVLPPALFPGDKSNILNSQTQ